MNFLKKIKETYSTIHNRVKEELSTFNEEMEKAQIQSSEQNEASRTIFLSFFKLSSD